jgi:hypothetical protein
MEKSTRISAEAEATRLFGMYGGTDRLARSMEFLRHHFDVIQARSQLLLTLATIALTITGFSGPKIAETGPFARYAMTVGIAFVLAAIALLLLGGLRIQWTSQLMGEDPIQTLIRIIRYRDKKTRLYFWELTLLVIGLTSYVASVASYLLDSHAGR